jgi:AcrR family transcriptional regulator
MLAHVNTVPYGMGMTGKLDQSGWVAAGLAALAAEGLDAVRVERLAGALQVTKGSFYWHFRDRSALLDAMIDAWRTTATGDIIARVEAVAVPPAERLQALFALVLRSDGRLEMAMRDWSAHDARVRAVVAEADRRRVAYVEELLVGVGVPAAEAGARARFIYQALIGHFRMGAGAADERAREALDIILPLMSRP